MAKKIEKSEEVVSGNIQNLEVLNKEFLNEKIEPRRLVALRIKLIALFHEGKITEDEQALMEKILKKDRVRNTISSMDNYLLNTIESDRCTNSCIVKVDDGPQTHHLFKDLKCKYQKDFDTDKFIVYVPRTVPTEHQISPEIAYKRLNNYPVDINELPKPRVLIHRIIITMREFKAWFEVLEDDIDFNGSSSDFEEEFKF